MPSASLGHFEPNTPGRCALSSDSPRSSFPTPRSAPVAGQRAVPPSRKVFHAETGECIEAFAAVDPKRAKGPEAVPEGGRDAGKGMEAGARTADMDMEKNRAPKTADSELTI